MKQLQNLSGASSYEQRITEFARIRALIMKLVRAKPGMTSEEISKQFLLTYGFLPLIDNRLREARQLGWVRSVGERGERLQWFPVEEAT